MDMSRLLSSHGHRRAVGTWWARTHARVAPRRWPRRHRTELRAALGSDGDHATIRGPACPQPRARWPPAWPPASVGRRGGCGHRDRGGRGAASTGASGIGDPYWPLDGNGGIDVHLRSPTATRWHQAAERPHHARADRAPRTCQLLPRLPAATSPGDRRRRTADFARSDGGHELRITPRRRARGRQQHTVVVDVRRPPGAARLRRGAQLARQQATRSSR
jgi:hypothetical protein